MIGVTPPVGGGSGGSSDIKPFKAGNFLIFKHPDNLNNDILEVNDGVIGVAEDTMINWGYYTGGDINLKASFDIVQGQPF